MKLTDVRSFEENATAISSWWVALYDGSTRVTPKRLVHVGYQEVHFPILKHCNVNTYRRFDEDNRVLCCMPLRENWNCFPTDVIVLFLTID